VIKHIVTLGFGFSGGVAFITTLGFAVGEAAATPDHADIGWKAKARRLRWKATP
jgi:hypothetical protein